MAIVKHFRVKVRLASFCCANLIKYKYTFCLVSLLFLLTSSGVESHLQREWRFSASYVVCCNKMFRWKRI